MVSVPDWAKFAKNLNKVKKSPTLEHRYDRQKAEKVIRQAEEHGYFLNPSKEFIEENFAPGEQVEKKEDGDSILQSLLNRDQYVKDVKKVYHVNLVESHLRSIGDIGMCTHLTICILSDNFITDIHGLESCSNLVKLDVHSNQISTLPGYEFWECLPFLRILNLHDNPLGKLENMQRLSSCQTLLALTLYDTPMSLKRNYRHHVVNSIWSLKALDHHVISDEEIIEDAFFGGIYSALSSYFEIDLCPQTSKDEDFDVEFKTYLQILNGISYILAHYSPVIIIQRYVRGYLVRKKGFVKTKRKENRRSSKSSPENTHSIIPASRTLSHNRLEVKCGSNDATNMDYDMYMRNRRPGSAGLKSANMSPIATNRAPSDQESLPYAPILGVQKDVNISLAQLHMGALNALQEDFQLVQPTGSLSHRDNQQLSNSQRIPHRSEWGIRKNVDLKRRLRKDVKEFLGRVVKNHPKTRHLPGDNNLDDLPLVEFRLRGIKNEPIVADPTMDMILQKKDDGYIVRTAESQFHKMKNAASNPKIEKHPFPKDLKMIRLRSLPGLSCLRAVQQAYKDRDMADKQTSRSNIITSMKEDRDISKERVKLYHEEKRMLIMKNREKDQKELIEALEQKELQRINLLEQDQELRKRSSHFAKTRKVENTFVRDFSTQNTSVSNALLRHDKQVKKDDALQERSTTVASIKHEYLEQQDIVKKYMAHRQLMLQTQSALAREALDAKLLHDTSQRLYQAKSRVANLKSRSAKTYMSNEEMPLPNISSTSLPRFIDARTDPRMGMLRRWSSLVPKESLTMSGR